MFLRNYIKKFLDLDESTAVDEYKRQLREAEIERDNWKSQANLDAVENIFLANKLKKLREVLGKDDECFSRFTRGQIRDMSIDAFRQVENEIDQDVAGGKRLLQ